MQHSRRFQAIRLPGGTLLLRSAPAMDGAARPDGLRR